MMVSYIASVAGMCKASKKKIENNHAESYYLVFHIIWIVIESAIQMYIGDTHL